MISLIPQIRMYEDSTKKMKELQQTMESIECYLNHENRYYTLSEINPSIYSEFANFHKDRKLKVMFHQYVSKYFSLLH